MRTLLAVYNSAGFVGVAIDPQTYVDFTGQAQKMDAQLRLCEMAVPVWLSMWDFLQNFAAWRLAWAMGVDKEWPESWQRFIVFHTKNDVRVAIIRLLGTVECRSAMIGSAKRQVEEWLSVAPHLRRYVFPLSREQLNYLVYATDRATARRMYKTIDVMSPRLA